MIGEIDLSVVAVVGVAKNCGKTTTMNALVARAISTGRTVGLVSAGLDGERSDALLGTPKPPVSVAPGTLLTSTRIALQRSPLDVEYLTALGFSTPLGEAVVVRASDRGEVILAGMRHGDDIGRAVDAMRAAGADQIWIDGAYGRVVGAQPGLADGVVVATGAVLSPSISVIVDETAALVDRLSLPVVTEAWQRTLLQQALEENRVLLGGPETTPVQLEAKSALIGLAGAGDRWTSEIEAVAIPGLVSDRVLQELLRQRASGTLLLGDGTTLRANRQLLRRFETSWEIRALHRSPVIGISFSPAALHGPNVDSEQLRDALTDRYPKMPVFNPLVGIQ